MSVGHRWHRQTLASGQRGIHAAKHRVEGGPGPLSLASEATGESPVPPGAFPGWKVFTSVEHQALGCKEMASREGGKVAGRPHALTPGEQRFLLGIVPAEKPGPPSPPLLLTCDQPACRVLLGHGGTPNGGHG